MKVIWRILHRYYLARSVRAMIVADWAEAKSEKFYRRIKGLK